MHGITELRATAPRIVRSLLVVIRLVAIGAPVPLVSACRGVEHDDTAIAVAVGDIEFVRIPVEGDLGGLAKLGGVVSALGRRDLFRSGMMTCVGRKLHRDVVVVGIAGQPDIALVRRLDPVLAADPL